MGERANPQILVVDDSADSTLAVAKLLSQRGYEVRIAGTCAAAVAAAQAGPVDLLLCDLGLPDGDGCDLFQQLRTMHGMKGIVISGSDDPDDVNRCLQAGYAAHILKPVQFDRLTAAIESVLSRPNQQR